MTVSLTEPLIIAVPKGRILNELLPVFERLDLKPEAEFFDSDSRRLHFTSNHPKIELIRVRSFDVATYVAFNAAQLGICGSDVLMEFDYPDIYAPLDLDIGHCHLALASRKKARKDYVVRWSHVRVATKYPNITRRYFAEKGIQAECIKLNGAIELAPNLGLSSHIVDLVSTGQTLKENGLQEEERIADISSRLIINRTAFKTRNHELNQLLAMCREAVGGEAA